MIEGRVGDEVRVEWLDPSHKYEVSESDASDCKPARVVSYGKVVRVDGDWIYVAHEWLDDDQSFPLRGVTCIHKALVRSYVPGMLGLV